MENMTTFCDKFLIQAAIDYSYRVSRFDIHQDPIAETKKRIKKDFNDRYQAVLIENSPIMRKIDDDKTIEIELRYMIIKDTMSNPVQHALIFQGSDVNADTIFSGNDTDWSNNLSSAVHLPVKNYATAKKEFKYLKDLDKYNITATSGNSLGGGYALTLARLDNKLRIVAVNPSPPEFGEEFLDTNNATIINTSTDILTRMLKVDVSRYNEEDYQKIRNVLAHKDLSKEEKTEKFDHLIQTLNYEVGHYYGFKTYPVERSLYFNESMYIEAAHRGTILEPREVVLDIFRTNMIPYSSNFASKVFSQTKELLDYSKYFIKWSTNTISNNEYRDLVDNYIEPTFMPVHKNKVDDFKNFVSLANFLQYDINTQNLINKEGKSLLGGYSYVIKDKEEFMNNLNASFIDYKKAIDYPIKRVVHDIEEEAFVNSPNNDLKRSLRFFASSFDITINFDLDIIEVFKGLPVAILFKIGELLDQNRRYLKGLKNNLVDYFKAEYSILTDPDLVKHYRRAYSMANKQVAEAVNTINFNLEHLIYNVEKSLDADISFALGYRHFQSKKVVKSFRNLNDLNLDYSIKEILKEVDNKNLVITQYNHVLDIIDDYRVSSVSDLSVNINKMEEILHSSIRFIEKKSNKSEEYRLVKLSRQLNAMLENIDLETIYYNALNVLRLDIAAIALKDTVAQSILTHYRQVIETNQQLMLMLSNLKLYIEENTTANIKKQLLLDVEKIETDINLVNNFVQQFIE